jgi:hypothetical protein
MAKPVEERLSPGIDHLKWVITGPKKTESEMEDVDGYNQQEPYCADLDLRSIGSGTCRRSRIRAAGEGCFQLWTDKPGSDL